MDVEVERRVEVEVESNEGRAVRFGGGSSRVESSRMSGGPVGWSGRVGGTNESTDQARKRQW